MPRKKHKDGDGPKVTGVSIGLGCGAITLSKSYFSADRESDLPYIERAIAIVDERKAENEAELQAAADVALEKKERAELIFLLAKYGVPDQFKDGGGK